MLVTSIWSILSFIWARRDCSIDNNYAFDIIFLVDKLEPIFQSLDKQVDRIYSTDSEKRQLFSSIVLIKEVLFGD